MYNLYVPNNYENKRIGAIAIKSVHNLMKLFIPA